MSCCTKQQHTIRFTVWLPRRVTRAVRARCGGGCGAIGSPTGLPSFVVLRREEAGATVEAHHRRHLRLLLEKHETRQFSR